MKNTHHSKDGYILVAVMVAVMTITILIGAIFKYGEIARIYYSGDLDATQAFWNAESGIAELIAITGNSYAPFGEEGLPNTDTPIERIVDAYLDHRDSAEETFLQAYRRLGMAPFKTALYGEKADKRSEAA